MQETLKKYFGFWDTITLTLQQQADLKKAYDDSFGFQSVKMDENMYSKNEPIAAVARKIINDIAMLSWASYAHSGGYVPVFAIGAGSNLFEAKTDNAEIPMKIAAAAGYKVKR